MAHIHADGVADTSTTTGTGAIAVSGTAPTGFRTFSAVCSTNDTFFYAIRHRTANEWEVGLGTYSASNEVTRTTVLKSSNAGSAVNFSAGTKDVFISHIADRDNPRLGGVPTDNAVARFDGTTGNLQNSGVIVDDSNNVSGVATLTTTGNIELGNASDTTLSRSAAGELAVEGTIVKKVGLETIWVPAAAMVARTTNGAASGTTELATNDVMFKSFDFDTSTEEGVGFMIAMPKSWNEGTVTFAPYWTAASGSGGVVFGLAAYAFSNDDAMDTAVSGQQTSTDTLITANDCHIGPTSSAITIGGTPAANDLVYFELTREVANGSDTLSVDAKLIGIQLYITTDASTDA